MLLFCKQFLTTLTTQKAPQTAWHIASVICLSLAVAACGGSGSGGSSPDVNSDNDSPGSGGGTPPPPAATSLTANSDTFELERGTVGTFDVLANDSTPNPPMQITNVSAVTSGNTSISDSSCCIQYSPNSTFTGTETITYTITDANGDTAQGTVTITVFNPTTTVNDTFDLFQNGRGAPLDFATLLANDTPKDNETITALDFPATTVQGGNLVLDNQASADFNDHIIRYEPVDGVASDSFTYTITDSDNNQVTGVVNITMTPPDACDVDIPKRKASGLGWCLETHFDSFDTGADDGSSTGGPDDGDGSGTNVAIQVFFPHPYHQRLNAIETGATLSAIDPGFSPLLIHSHGFGGSKQEDFQEPGTFLDNQVAKAAWEDGYNVISYTQRGFGGTQTNGDNERTGDSIGILAPNLEGFDFIRLVDWAICHFRADAPLENATDAENFAVEANDCATDFNGANSWGPSLIAQDGGTRLTGFDDDVALATVGYSYGGGFQFMAQSVDSRVDAIMPMGTWHDLRFALHPNDTPKTFWIQILNQFAGTTPGLGGGNGEPLPPVIPQALSEATGANSDTTDAPHNKSTQVSVASARELGSKGALAYCHGNQTYYSTKYGDADGDPESLVAINPTTGNPDPSLTPAHLNVTARAPRANLFMIQGYGDTLFNYNEGYDNARCFEDAGVTDVRMLQETSGHPFPTNDNLPTGSQIPPHYAGSDQSMYLDEVVHCGLDVDGNPRRYNMVVTLKQWMDFHTRGGLLADGLASDADIFPKACIVQQNADQTLTLDQDDPFYNGMNSATNGFKWPREGVVFDSVAETPVGHSQYLQNDGTPMPNFPLAVAMTDPLTTGTAAATGNLTNGTFRAVPLHTTTRPEGEVMAGIPLVHLEVTRQMPANDEIFYVGVYVQRCNEDPDNTVLDGNNVAVCNPNLTPELLHFQAQAIRVFDTPAADAANASLPATVGIFPRIDPRNFVNSGTDGSFYPLVNGDNLPTSRSADDTTIVNNSSLTNPQGRLIGISARLHLGDEVGLALLAGQASYLTTSTVGAGTVTLNGSVQLPLINTNALQDAPTNVPTYVIEN